MKGGFEIFRDPLKTFSVVLFIQEDDFTRRRDEIEALGKQRNVKLVIQPCPFEGVEFLYRVGHELFHDHISMDNELFWQAVVVRQDTPAKVLDTISDHHHQYLCAILEQDAAKVSDEGKELETLAGSYR